MLPFWSLLLLAACMVLAALLVSKKETKPRSTDVAYKHVKFMPMSIWSGPGDVNGKDPNDCRGFENFVGKYSRDTKQQPDLECYKGVLNDKGEADPVRDMQLRMQYVEDAFDVAKQTQSESSECLNIFMLPEFFFRSVRGGYRVEDMLTDDAIMHPIEQHLLEPMKQMALNNPDWLFVFGTIILYQIDDQGRVHVNNLSPVLHRNTKMMVCKTHVSTIDFLTVQGDGDHVLPNPTSVSRRMRSELYNTGDVEGAHKFASRMGFQVAYNTFCLRGIKFGLDICLDHAYGVTKERTAYPAGPYAGDGSVEDGTGAVDVHLITSAGMSIMQKNVATDHGLVLLCDGEANVDTMQSAQRAGVVSAYMNGGKEGMELEQERPVGSSDYRVFFGTSFYKDQSLGIFEPMVRTYAEAELRLE